MKDKPDYYDNLSPALKAVYETGIIDVGLVLKRMAGKQKILEMSAKMAGNSMVDKIAQLREYFDKNMLEEFAFDMHAIKSSLGNIGAVKYAEIAEMLEKAAKDGHAEYLEKNFYGFAEGVEDLGEKLREIFGS